MADYGFRLVRDACGKNSTPEAIDRSWKLDEMRTLMDEKVEAEIAELDAKGIKARAIKDEGNDTVEIRDDGGMLISWYEVEEFEHC